MVYSLSAAAAAALIGSLLIAPSAVNAQDVDEAALNQAAIAWIDLLQAGEWEEAEQEVSPDVVQQMSATRLAEIWAQLGAQLGSLESLDPGSVTVEGDVHLVDLGAKFANGTFNLRVAYTADSKVTGIFVLPPGPE